MGEWLRIWIQLRRSELWMTRMGCGAPRELIAESMRCLGHVLSSDNRRLHFLHIEMRTLLMCECDGGKIEQL